MKIHFDVTTKYLKTDALPILSSHPVGPALMQITITALC